MGTHSSKVQGKREQKQTQPKEKTKANNQVNTLRAKRTRDYEMTIHDKKKKAVICHNSASDKDALAIATFSSLT